MRRETTLRALRVLGLIAATVLSAGGRPAAAQEKTAVPVELGWTTDGRAAFLYLGIETGTYAAEGLDVRVHRGRGAVAMATDVSQGRFLFGINTDLSAILPLRQKGSDIKGIMVMNARSPHGFQALAEKNIRTPKDFEGHSVGLQPGSLGEKFFAMLVAANGVDVAKVRIVPLSGDVYVPAFLEGRIDLINGLYDALYQSVRLRVEKRGKAITSVWAKDWGLDTLGNMIITREQTLREQPDMVRRFLRASKRALDATRADQAAALNAILKHNQELERDITQAQLQAFLELAVDPDAGPGRIGCADGKKLQRSVDIFRQALGIGTPVPADQAFTNEFMEWCR
ncbi:MAG TPA: ABC transporter substrate-binding protein [Candidatus Methylomirabilis sp.]|jgi:NitT/TauT family transport system substrate-binding protein